MESKKKRNEESVSKLLHSSVAFFLDLAPAPGKYHVSKCVSPYSFHFFLYVYVFFYTHLYKSQNIWIHATGV